MTTSELKKDESIMRRNDDGSVEGSAGQARQARLENGVALDGGGEVSAARIEGRFLT